MENHTYLSPEEREMWMVKLGQFNEKRSNPGLEMEDFHWAALDDGLVEPLRKLNSMSLSFCTVSSCCGGHVGLTNSCEKSEKMWYNIRES